MKTGRSSVIPGHDELASPESIDPPHLLREGFLARPFGPPRNVSGEASK
jgi:hypothetical protein